jgi:hypothetical protein
MIHSLQMLLQFLFARSIISSVKWSAVVAVLLLLSFTVALL